jgi:HK97 family phage portal protein
MNVFGRIANVFRKDAQNGGQDVDTILRRLHAFYDTVSGIHVTPETCMQAPTVQAIVGGVGRRFAAMPVQVVQKGTRRGRETRQPLPNHPAAIILNAPNAWQTRVNFWLDASSVLLRYHNFYAFKAAGKTGPIRRVVPIHPTCCQPHQTSDYDVVYKVTAAGGQRDVEASDMIHARGAARDFLVGDSPVYDVREAIALEIAAEKFGASFFGNGALPFIVFKFLQGKTKGFKDEADENAFLDSFQQMYTKGRQFRAFALPPGMEISAPIDVENNKAQFLETRKYQRTVIAAAWGVPPHIAGDLERATFNNIEQQSLDIQISVILPYAMMFEAALERDLLTEDDRKNGVCIRFNMDAALRGDFKSRQDGLAIQRQWGIISANEWREREYMNPIDEDWADEQILPTNYSIAGEPLPTEGAGAQDEPPEAGGEEEEETAPPPQPKGFDFWESLRKDVGDARSINLRSIRGGRA